MTRPAGPADTTGDTGTTGDTRFPLADRATVRRWVVGVAVANRAAFTVTIGAFVASTLVALIAPQLLGALLDTVADRDGRPADDAASTVDLIAVALLVVLVVQALLRRSARLRAAMLGEKLLATAREDFVSSVLRLPLSTVESTSSGDLMSRATADVDRLDEGLRTAVPEIVIAAVTVLLTVVAMLLTAPIPALGMLVAVPVLAVATRWYRPRVNTTYDAELAGWADLQAVITETVDGAATVQQLGRGQRRVAVNRAALRRVRAIGTRQSRLWGTYCASFEVSYVLPLVAIVLIGWWCYQHRLVDIGALAAVLVYAQSLSDPLVDALSWLDELMVGGAALRRILGVRLLGSPAAGSAEPLRGNDIRLRDVRFAYRDGAPVLRGIDLDIRDGERLVVVGPSGAGKSTLGRLIAGVSAPTGGSVTLGGVPVAALGAERLRHEVVLLTQEQHVFAASVRDNLTLLGPTGDERLRSALRTVGLGDWLAALPDGLDTRLGIGAEPVRGAAAQQLALARLVLADPHTVVLDEATSLLGAAASRRLDRSLAAVLRGRTVVVIAHRLDIARTADRVAVVEDGRITELGGHDELVAAAGSYARLFARWSAGVR